MENKMDYLKAHNSPKEERLKETQQGKRLETESNAEGLCYIVTVCYIVCKFMYIVYMWDLCSKQKTKLADFFYDPKV